MVRIHLATATTTPVTVNPSTPCIQQQPLYHARLAQRCNSTSLTTWVRLELHRGNKLRAAAPSAHLVLHVCLNRSNTNLNHCATAPSNRNTISVRTSSRRASLARPPAAILSVNTEVTTVVRATDKLLPLIRNLQPNPTSQTNSRSPSHRFIISCAIQFDGFN